MSKLKEMFLKNGKTVTYKSNDVIFNEHDICKTVGYIIKGRVKISTFTGNENEVTINLLNTNDIFGDLLVFSSNPYYYGIGICLENTTINYISKDKLISLLSSDSLFLAEFLNLITNKGVSLKQMNKLYAHKNIEERFTYYIYHIAKRIDEHKVYYKSVTDIAHILSIPRPSLSRTIHKMEKEGKITISKNIIEIKN